jgi:hypothetical protein
MQRTGRSASMLSSPIKRPQLGRLKLERITVGTFVLSPERFRFSTLIFFSSFRYAATAMKRPGNLRRALAM